MLLIPQIAGVLTSMVTNAQKNGTTNAFWSAVIGIVYFAIAFWFML